MRSLRRQQYMLWQGHLGVYKSSKMIVLDNQPLSILQDKGFRKSSKHFAITL